MNANSWKKLLNVPPNRRIHAFALLVVMSLIFIAPLLAGNHGSRVTGSSYDHIVYAVENPQGEVAYLPYHPDEARFAESLIPCIEDYGGFLDQLSRFSSVLGSMDNIQPVNLKEDAAGFIGDSVPSLDAVLFDIRSRVESIPVVPEYPWTSAVKDSFLSSMVFGFPRVEELPDLQSMIKDPESIRNKLLVFSENLEVEVGRSRKVQQKARDTLCEHIYLKER